MLLEFFQDYKIYLSRSTPRIQEAYGHFKSLDIDVKKITNTQKLWLHKFIVMATPTSIKPTFLKSLSDLYYISACLTKLKQWNISWSKMGFLAT